MKSIEKLTDQQLALAARNIEAERKLRASRKAAALAILAVLKKHKLSVNDLPELKLNQIPKRREKKKKAGNKVRRVKLKNATASKNDKRSKVAFKYKNPNGGEKWSGRGRPPKWVSDIIAKKRISIEQFKANKHFKI